MLQSDLTSMTEAARLLLLNVPCAPVARLFECLIEVGILLVGSLSLGRFVFMYPGGAASRWMNARLLKLNFIIYLATPNPKIDLCFPRAVLGISS